MHLDCQQLKMEKLKLISVNVNGLNSPTKRSKIWSQLKNHKADIIFLQETHVKTVHSSLLRCKAIGQEYFASAKEKKRDVVIYIKNKDIQVLEEIKDPEARFIILKCKLPDESIWLLANVYAPNLGKTSFFKNLMSTLSDIAETNIILAGDFNAVPNPKLDKSRSIEGNKFPKSVLKLF